MKPLLSDPDLTLWNGDALSVLRELPDASVDMCVTSPPYFQLRDYEVEGQIGLEATPEEFVANLVEIFREVRRVLAPHGTVWLNLGDSYAANRSYQVRDSKHTDVGNTMKVSVPPGLKPKDLMGVPWRVAFALQADGWWLRSDIIFHKPNAMPESVTDRPSSSHEYLFLLTPADQYYYDRYGAREPAKWERWGDQTSPKYGARPGLKGHGIKAQTIEELELERRRAEGKNLRSVWSIPTKPYPDAHFATFPPELPRRAILVGCPAEVCRVCGKPRERIVDVDYENPGNRSNNGRRLSSEHRKSGVRTMAANKRLEKVVKTTGWTDCGHGDFRRGVVMDPFGGAGTTGLVAREEGRHSVLIELSEEYCKLIADRLQQLSLLA